MSLMLLALLVALFVPVTAGADQHPVEVVFFDVGEGDATLIRNRGPSCAEQVMVDTGNLRSGAQLSERLRRDASAAIDYLIITHPDPDHIGGVFSLLAQHQIAALYDNGQPFTAAELIHGINRWYQQTLREHPRYKPLRSPSEIRLRCGGSLQVLAPAAGALDSQWNANSLVLLFQREQFSLLLMGDALLESERRLLAQGVKFPSAISVLRAGHHGSAATGDEAFIRAANPRLVVVSVGAGNPYGYPAAEVIARYQATAPVLRTDRDGEIVVSSALKEGFEYRTVSRLASRPDKPRSGLFQFGAEVAQ